jgi:hypothetical protein
MLLLSRGRKPRIHLCRAKPRICRRRSHRFIEVSVTLRRRPRADATLLLAPGVPAPERPRVDGKRREFRRGSGMPEAGWELRLSILGLQPPQMSCLFGDAAATRRQSRAPGRRRVAGCSGGFHARSNVAT